MKTLDDQLDDYKMLKYRMNEEGMTYCFIHYSRFEEIEDKEFHKLRKQFIKLHDKLKLHVDNKIEEIETKIEEEL